MEGSTGEGMVEKDAMVDKRERAFSMGHEDADLEGYSPSVRRK